MPVTLTVRADVSRLRASLDALAARQLPFATAQALTAIARKVQAAETAALPSVFDRPTPFTLRAFGVKPARKTDLTAIVFAKDIQAAYLMPYEFGGKQLGRGARQAVLKPVNAAVNSYGNLPRGIMRRYAGRKDVFVGRVTFKDGQSIVGVWQRPQRGERRAGGRGTKGRTHQQGVSARTGLKLLVRVGDPAPVHARLGFAKRAGQVVSSIFRAELGAALDRALRTAR